MNFAACWMARSLPHVQCQGEAEEDDKDDQKHDAHCISPYRGVGFDKVNVRQVTIKMVEKEDGRL